MRSLVHGRFPDPTVISTESGMGLRSLAEIRLQPKVVALDLQSNRIPAVVRIANAAQLECLLLGDNLLEDLSESQLPDYSELRILDLGTNLISKIQTVDELRHLVALDMSRNRIAVLENLEGLTALQSLWIGQNRIHSVFLTQSLLSLTFLDASFNYLQDFPIASRFPNLTTLELNHCFISSFRCFCNLPKLQNLSISHNQICDDEVLELPLLVRLNVSHNFLTGLDFLAKCWALKSLDVSFNPIDDDGFSIDFVFSRLKDLNISGTKLQHASLLRFAPALRRCLCENVHIVDLNAFLKAGANLTELDLRGTALTAGLYFDRNDYRSIGDYDRLFPENSEQRAAYRRSILELNPRLVKLDGILTAGDDRDGKKRSLLHERREARTPRKLPPERRSRPFRAATIRTVSDVSEPKRPLSPATPTPKRKSKSATAEAPIAQVSLEAEAAIAQLATASPKSISRSRQYVYERCSAAILQFARDAPEAKTVLLPGSSEFKIVQAFICSKMTIRIELLSAVRNNCSQQFLKMEQTCRGICLVVDDGLDSARSFERDMLPPIVVADHMNHLVRRIQKSGEVIFLICAFDNGRTMVDTATGHAPSDSIGGKFDSLLFQVHHNQFFSVLNQERITALYLVRIRPVPPQG
jgi:Leucine-rich repeat (LRR) protein